MGGFRNTLRIEGDCAVVSNNKAEILIDAADAGVFKTHNLYIHCRRDNLTVTAVSKETGARTKLSRVITDAAPGLVVDHINGNPLDNRRANLRIVTQLENRRNAAKRPGLTSIYKGVSAKSPRSSRWRALIYVNNKATNLGFYETEEEAARAYDAAARDIFGAAATLNFPNSGEQHALRPRARDAIDAQLSKLRPAA